MSGDPFDYQSPPAKVVGKGTIKLERSEGDRLTISGPSLSAKERVWRTVPPGYEHIFCEAFGSESGIRVLNGMSAKDAKPLLDRAIATLVASYGLLEDLRSWCDDSPNDFFFVTSDLTQVMKRTQELWQAWQGGRAIDPGEAIAPPTHDQIAERLSETYDLGEAFGVALKAEFRKSRQGEQMVDPGEAIAPPTPDPITARLEETCDRLSIAIAKRANYLASTEDGFHSSELVAIANAALKVQELAGNLRHSRPMNEAIAEYLKELADRPTSEGEE